MQNLNYETLTFFSRLPSQLPPPEHYKGRHSLDVDLLRWAENLLGQQQILTLPQQQVDPPKREAVCCCIVDMSMIIACHQARILWLTMLP